jgi:hypothetical protein
MSQPSAPSCLMRSVFSPNHSRTVSRPTGSVMHDLYASEMYHGSCRGDAGTYFLVIFTHHWDCGGSEAIVNAGLIMIRLRSMIVGGISRSMVTELTLGFDDVFRNKGKYRVDVELWREYVSVASVSSSRTS